MKTEENPVHKGPARRYWCPDFMDDKGRLHQTFEKMGGHLRGCETRVIQNGEPIPKCREHDQPMVKTRYMRVEEKAWALGEKIKFRIAPGRRAEIAGWTDVARRKSLCKICLHDIEKGEVRVAFDMNPPYGPQQRSLHGGVIGRTRFYMHRSCLVDVMFDGQAGKGCPGCTAKMLNDDFRAVKKIWEKRLERAD